MACQHPYQLAKVKSDSTLSTVDSELDHAVRTVIDMLEEWKQKEAGDYRWIEDDDQCAASSCYFRGTTNSIHSALGRLKLKIMKRRKPRNAMKNIN